jgi:transposase InsO family protein
MFLDLRKAYEKCSRHRVARHMHENGRALHGSLPNAVWATDITYVCTCQSWLYLAVVLDMYLCEVVRWVAGPTAY